MPVYRTRIILRVVDTRARRRPRPALAREKQLKGWRRAKKVALINAENPAWRDLAARPGAFASSEPSS